MSYYRNLIPGQYQIGDIVMGHGTNIIMENFDVKPYDVNQQDYQVSRSNEIRFGYDSFKPTSIEMNMQVIYNWLLDPYKNTRTNFWHNMPTVGDLAREWRSDEIRSSWNEMKPLYFCGRDGIGKVIYGRPGQFGVEKTDSKSTIVKCVGEFRRADTLVYSVNENVVQLSQNEVPQFLWRGVGDAASWLRVVGYGPLVNPVITVGENQISLNITVAEGEAFEVSSYPWQRRAVKSDRTNLRNNLVNNSPYLDKMMIPVKQFIPVRWTASNVNMWVPDLGNANWSVDISNKLTAWALPAGFVVKGGSPKVRLDLFNPAGPTKFIGGKEIGGISACLYTAKKFNTTTQFMQARIVEPFSGRSGMAIMSNLAMTNYALLEVVSGGTNQLIIRTGNAWNSWSTAKATYTKSGRWSESDIVGFGYNPSNQRYSAYINGTEVVYWTDSGNIVTPSATTNCYSGFVFDMDNNLLTLGTGFKDITAYDKVLTQVDTGSVYLYWRDAWSTIE